MPQTLLALVFSLAVGNPLIQWLGGFAAKAGIQRGSDATSAPGGGPATEVGSQFDPNGTEGGGDFDPNG